MVAGVPAFSRFVMIRPVQTTRPRSGEHCCFCNGQGPQVVRNDPGIGPITRERRGPGMVAEVYHLPYQSRSSGSAGQPVLARQVPG
jgi:hypothetical protein